MEKPTTPRAGERRSLRLVVQSRVESRTVYVDLVDISEGGCKIRGSRGFASIGDRVTMKVGGLYAPVGEIAWLEDRVAGVRFQGEMHPAVLDHLCAAQVPDLAVEEDVKNRRI